MRLRIYTNILNGLIKAPEVVVPGNITVKQLLEYFVETYGERIRNRIFENDSPQANIIIILNGKSINFSDELETMLHENDTISIITAIVGG